MIMACLSKKLNYWLVFFYILCTEFSKGSFNSFQKVSWNSFVSVSCPGYLFFSIYFKGRRCFSCISVSQNKLSSRLILGGGSSSESDGISVFFKKCFVWRAFGKNGKFHFRLRSSFFIIISNFLNLFIAFCFSKFKKNFKDFLQCSYQLHLLWILTLPAIFWEVASSSFIVQSYCLELNCFQEFWFSFQVQIIGPPASAR